LAVGNFGASFVDGTIVDYVTGMGRITAGPADGVSIYNGGTSARNALMTLDSSGNMGVGTASPKSNGTNYTTLTLNNTNNGGVVEFTNNNNTIAQIYNNSTDLLIYGNTNKNVGLYTTGTGVITANTGGSERMRIDSSGRVGIGGSTVTDVHLLNIQGSNATNNVGIVLNKTNGTAQIWSIQNNNVLTFYDYTANAARMTLDTSGMLLVSCTSAPSGGSNGVGITGVQGTNFWQSR
jgi:hypothetical protein